jgi:hypothetical protein
MKHTINILIEDRAITDVKNRKMEIIQSQNVEGN